MSENSTPLSLLDYIRKNVGTIIEDVDVDLVNGIIRYYINNGVVLESLATPKQIRHRMKTKMKAVGK